MSVARGQVVTFYLRARDAEVLESLKAMAAAEERSMSEMLSRALREWVGGIRKDLEREGE